MFIQTESTPNPESIKFIPGRGVLTDLSSPPSLPTPPGDDFYADDDDDIGNDGILQGVHITKSEEDKELLRRSPLSKTLLMKIPGIKSLYLGGDFISVTKTPVVKWETVRPLIFEAIMDFYADTEPGEYKVRLYFRTLKTEHVSSPPLN